MGAIAGKVMIRPRGDYNPSAVYDMLDLVKYDNKPWICRRNNISGITPVEGDDWMNIIDISVSNADTLDGFHADHFATVEGTAQAIAAAAEEVTRVVAVTFLADGWSESAPYTQTVSVNGITENDAPIPLFIDDGTSEAGSKAKQKAYGFVSYFDSGDGTVTATCKYKKPETAFTVGLKGV